MYIANSYPYIDFTNANATLPSAQNNGTTSAGLVDSYLFEIYNGSTRRFYVSATITISNSIYTTVLNKNGTTSTSTSSEYNFTPAVFGKLSSGLYSCNYTMNLTTTYQWVSMPTTTSMTVYQTTATMSGNLQIDYTSPTVSAVTSSGNVTIADGAYINQLATIKASDTNFRYLYYRRPNYSSYSVTTSSSYSISGTNGWYYYYAVDYCGNKSTTKSFYYDSVKPTGLLYSGGSSISSGSYISNSFSYSVTDSGSGIANIYYKTPVSGSYQTYASGTIIPANSGDGWYYFYAVDKAGNISDTMTVYLETASPVVTIYKNGVTAYTNTISSSGTYDPNLYFNPSDTIKIGCKTSSGNVTSNFALNTNISLSSYVSNSYMISLKSATGISMNFPFKIVKEKPSMTIGGTKYASGSTIYLSEDSTAIFNLDSVITNYGSTGFTINDEFTSYEAAMSKTFTAESGETKTYKVSLNDRAENISTYTVVVDKDPTNATWYSNGVQIENGGYTNQSAYLEFLDSDGSATYSFNGSEYMAYASGTPLDAEGSYNIIITDLAGNKSTYNITIDKTAPTGTLYENYQVSTPGIITNKPIYFTWDGEATCQLNGADYTKNTVISDNGIYQFILTDKAGNFTSYKAEIDTIAPSYNQEKLSDDDSYYVSKWWNVVYNNDKSSYGTYSEALSAAYNKEYEANVTTLTLNDVNDFNQTHLVANNNDESNHDDEVRTGTYWIYKSKANPAIELYYFDENLLKEVIEYYAKNYVSGPNYYQGTTPDYGTLDSSMSDNLGSVNGIVAPIANNFSFTNKDSISIRAKNMDTNVVTNLQYGVQLKNQLSDSGLYEITEVDEAGNVSNYYLIIDKSAPILNVNAEIFGNEQASQLTITEESLANIKAYYYKTFTISSITDSDSWSVVKITNDNKSTYYTKGETIPTLNEGGKYDITTYDRLGNSYSFTVYIVGNPAEVEFTNNRDDTSFEVDITLEQDFDTLVSLEIYRNGTKLDNISTDKLHYEFDKDGTYTVIMKDNFGRVIEKTYRFDKALPEGILNGVSNNDKTNDDVNFTYDSTKYYAEVYKDGSLLETDRDGEVTYAASNSTSGYYQIKLINLTDEDNYQVYSFEIDTIAPSIDVSGVEISHTTNGNVVVSYSDEDIVSSTYSINGGEEKSFTSGQSFSEEGIYVITLKDDLGNTSQVTFTIDKSLNYSIYDNDNTDLNSDSTTSKGVVIENNEDLNITVYKDGEIYEYDFGNSLTEEGVYTIRIYDDFGNSTTFTITIDKSVSFGSNVDDGIITNEDVYFTPGEQSTIVVTKDGQPYSYSYGDSITEEGSYKVIITDNYGNTKEVNFQIVKQDQTSIDYVLGDDVEIISITKDGEEVSWDSNELNFTEDGTYVVTVRKDGKQYSFNLTLDTTAPVATLNGVSDGGKVDGEVSITEVSEEGTIEVYKDGEKIDYEVGQTLSEYGHYEVVLTDLLGNSRTYSFDLEFQMNGWAIALVGIGVISIAGVVIGVILNKRRIFKKKR